MQLLNAVGIPRRQAREDVKVTYSVYLLNVTMSPGANTVFPTQCPTR